ncbi:ODV-E18 [Bombyx mandarina nucleopolyhedrovirus]|uniref:ODV-E18 n=2 Tax=Bombyx mori nuclear polyhedrosis virus TaxID=271108 RepID=O92495_NPVBM|nr:ODV-E18 [Bombyx mori nucleopolyhedrovirus]ACQ57316.1 ODV-E18 [Bombyx mandarina nucleopolyhedrovirus]AFO10095.1 ODV-E18 [Bombyx mandarina nucleopolyhedrovirus S2]AAC63809.1 ODV-E18 [Bombyx mori nucleopolyhedrovirus]AFN09048.1 ODV-E18 [Bombyx mori nucleopolyhedrovirus]AFN21099.1 ODV-E18 [Bombyx mori nucleopolyhedrovirus]
MIYTDPTTGATTSTDVQSANYLNRLTPNMFLTILAVVVIIALIIMFVQSNSNNGNSSGAGSGGNGGGGGAATPPSATGFMNPLNATMRANPFMNTPQRQML